MSNTTLERPTGVAAAHRWALDPERSIVEFSVPTFWGLSTVNGRFDRFDGFYDLDAEDPVIELTVAADSLDTGNATRDKHLRSEDFFGVATHPQVRFRSTSINELGGALALKGRLQAAGGDVPVALQATVREKGDELEIEAATTVDHRELGMTHSPLGMIRGPARLHVRARLVQDRGDE